MSALIAFLVAFVCVLIGGIAAIVIFESKMIHNCNGMIIMNGDSIYLALSEEDKEAFKTKRYATLRLHREEFRGFNE